ncbi:carboxypeptidase-like regulatory domain-containing protein [Fulvivirgaceae bacterium BMA12]|uniref:Carboxypeptidase-like regulatory domain-containing protein n=1 Tax=Agaribacillus aureus TaxID=3051825 RepID=A0ABT8LAE5_9BACT|nr:carboxypeptidase-like regulatory domain-containing protein [Fulvivirgaceae bacterium BMA12]
MSIRNIILFVLGLSITFIGKSQQSGIQKIISVDFKNESLKGAIRKLSKDPDIHFSYSESLLNLEKRISLSLKGVQVSQVLDKLFNGANVSYAEVGDQIVLTRKIATRKKTGFRTLSGFISDRETGENLVGVSLFIADKHLGVTTNEYGYYMFTLPEGEYTVSINYLGYKSQQYKLLINKDQRLDLTMEVTEFELGEVVIQGQAEQDILKSTSMGQVRLTPKELGEYPAFFGEPDIVRGLQQYAGVQTVNEASNGLYVRGSPWDQTLIQLDEATVFNVSHMGGLFSVFNPDAVQNVKLYKGSMPAALGGRLSSVLDIRMKEGNKYKFSGAGGIGTLASRLFFEGPIKKGKSSFMISGRRSYLDLILKNINDEDVRSNELYFIDLNGKFNIEVNKNNRLFISGYWGRDRLELQNTFGVNWGNKNGTLRWNHIFNQNLFLNTSLLASSFDYQYTADDNNNNFKWNGRFNAYNARLDFYRFVSPRWQADFGYHINYFQFFPIKIRPLSEKSLIDPFDLTENNALEHSWYLQNDLKLSERLTASIGLRYSLFQNVGPGEIFTYEEGLPKSNATIVDTLRFDSWEKITNYHGFEPRLAINYEIDSRHALKASYIKTRQYLHAATTSSSGLPNDRWFASNFHIKPQIADQVSIGVVRKSPQKKFLGLLEIYYKYMQNQLDFRLENNALLRPNLETLFLAGKAWSYGVELSLEKTIGKTIGRLNYTLSKSQRKIDGINEGRSYSPVYDRRHDLSIQLIHRFNRRITLSNNWVYVSGRPISLPVGKYEIQGIPVIQYDNASRNKDRLRPYHRLDISLEIKGKNKKQRRWHGSWNFSLYNVYFRKNPIGHRFRNVINGDVSIDEDDPDVVVESKKFQATEIFLFRFVPSVTYNFKF